MDTFAHGIWSYLIFGTFTNPYLAVFFGMMPDLFSWTIYLIYGLLFDRQKLKREPKPNPKNIPKWPFVLYGITHSVFTMAVVFSLVYIITGGIPLYLWAWPLHVAIDIPTHSRKYLPTPFLWPVSDWKFPGFSWANKWFMIINYGLIVIVWILI